MTVTHRKTVESATQVAAVPVTEPGISYECDSCDQDITHTIRIKCAATGCEEIDLCVSCFCQGKEVGDHKAWHDYRVVEQHPYPIFSEDWGADEELLLIEGLMANGLGNWTAAAEHIGTRTPEETEQHYFETYLNSPNWPLPVADRHFATSSEDFHYRKRKRIAAMRQAALELANAVSKPHTVLTSAPTNHEIQGYMSGRLDFETEIENDAEEHVKDLEFGLVMGYGGADQPEPGPPPASEPSTGEKNTVEGGPGSGDAESNDTTLEGSLPDPIETEDSTALKVTLLDMYYEKLDRRQESKTFVFDRGMLDFKKWQAHEKKRPREDRELIGKHKPFSKLQTAEDFEKFMNGVMQENALRIRIKELQEYRRNGITSLADAEKWTRDSATRYLKPNGTYANHLRQSGGGGGRSSLPPISMGYDQSHSSFDGLMSLNDTSQHSLGHGQEDSKPRLLSHSRRPAAPLNLANADSLHLLTPTEQVLCSQLRILPKPFLVVKETLVSEFARRGGNLKRRDARDLVKIDVNKTSRIWDYLEAAGLLVARGGSGGAQGGMSALQS